MDVDLFTWVAQIINFLILMGLLRHFLYGRIIHAIDQREQRIADRWHEAEDERDKAARQAESYAAERAELEQKQNEMLARTKEDAEKQKQQWLQEARAEVDRARQNWHAALRRQQQSFIADLRAAAATEIVNTVRKILRDIADEDLERQTLREFTKRLTRTDEQTQQLQDFVRRAGRTLAVNTSFELAQDQRESLQKAIRSAAGQEVDIRFGTSGDLLCGVELRADGRKIAWSIQDYLESLQESVNEMLKQATGHPQESGPTTVRRQSGEQTGEESAHGHR